MVDFWDSFLRMASALALVLALIAGLVVLVRRFSGTRWFAGARLFSPVAAPIVQVLGSGYIGPRKTISLVSVAGEYLIVGATPTDLVSFGRITDQEQVRLMLSRLASGSPAVSPGLSSGLPVQASMERKGGHGTA
ncbi:MAG: flagellar biosynthetic protein FliO [Nitrospira sp.]|jgi:flagellar protein FliO/FliZ|nr:flagellar biosynthetic protein FliO [Nitrospira sp.]